MCHTYCRLPANIFKSFQKFSVYIVSCLDNIILYNMPQKRRTTAASSSAGGKKKKGVEIPRAAGNQGKVSNEVTNTIDELCDATASTSSGTISNSTGPQPLRSFCDSLGLHLNQAVKVRIQKGEFIELGSLLTPPGSAPPSMSFALVKEGQKLVLGQQVDKSPSIGSIEEWTSAFLIYMSVYLEVHSDRAIQMLKYVDTIRSAAHQFGGMGWKTYDIQFRLKQAMNPTQSWATIDSELWLRVLLSPKPFAQVGGFRNTQNFRASAGSSNQFRQSTFQSNPGKGSQGYQGSQIGICWAYNGSGQCKKPNCSFQHRCATCRKFGHAAINCQGGRNKEKGNVTLPNKVAARNSSHTN